MVLNNKAFEKVKQVTGYEHAQYQGAVPLGIKFKVWDGPEFEPTRGVYAIISECFTLMKTYQLYYITEDGIKTFPE